MMINIAGCDGSGKSTQIELLQGWIRQTFGCAVRVVSKHVAFDVERFPECAFFGCSYEELADRFLLRMPGESRALLLFYLFAVSIRHDPPRAGEVVLFDGYWPKNYATEAALGIDPAWLLRTASFFPVPDVSVLLEVAPELVAARLTEYKPYECGTLTAPGPPAFVAHQTKILAFLKELAEREGWAVVDASQPAGAIFAQLKALLHDRIAGSVAGARA